MDADKYTYIKIAHLKIKRLIIVEIKDISSHIVEKNTHTHTHKKEYEI